MINLLSKRAGTLHLGVANYCWFIDPSRALCLKLAGTPTTDKPLAGMCDSARCPQATHHPCHRDVWADTVTQTTAFLGNLGRTPRDAQITRLKQDNADLHRRLAGRDAQIAEHEAFKTLAISRLAAQHDEIHRLRAAHTAPTGTVRALPARRSAGQIGPC